MEQTAVAERNCGVKHRRDDFLDFFAGKPRLVHAFPPLFAEIPKRFFLPAKIRWRERVRSFERVRKRHYEKRRIVGNPVIENFDKIRAVGQGRVFFDGAEFPLGAPAFDNFQRKKALRALPPRKINTAEAALADFS